MIPGIVCNIENKKFVYLGKFYVNSIVRKSQESYENLRITKLKKVDLFFFIGEKIGRSALKESTLAFEFRIFENLQKNYRHMVITENMQDISEIVPRLKLESKYFYVDVEPRKEFRPTIILHSEYTQQLKFLKTGNDIIFCQYCDSQFVGYMAAFKIDTHKRVPFDENFQVEDFNSVEDVRSKMSERDDSKYQLCVLKNII